MSGNLTIYLIVAALVTFAIRALPMFIFHKPIKNRFVRSFLYYVPYITLSVMVFPAIVLQTGSLISGIAAMAVGVLVAWFTSNLFLTASTVCVVALILELIL
ncbi:MAG: AzlD domain-containing protein [Clostridia bacterium]|nr:AzlD domain-containing protein [Clostridia bacterium]